MVQATVEDDFRFRASDIERDLSQPSYTVQTLSKLSEKYPDIDFTLIMGGDNLATFPWEKTTISFLSITRFSVIHAKFWKLEMSKLVRMFPY